MQSSGFSETSLVQPTRYTSLEGWSRGLKAYPPELNVPMEVLPEMLIRALIVQVVTAIPVSQELR